MTYAEAEKPNYEKAAISTDKKKIDPQFQYSGFPGTYGILICLLWDGTEPASSPGQ